jgi:hypothetical protein
MIMLHRFALGVLIVAFFYLWSAQDAQAWYGVTELDYDWGNDSLSGFSATYREAWDSDFSQCEGWDYDYDYEEYYCTEEDDYYFSMYVNGNLYAPTISGPVFTQGAQDYWEAYVPYYPDTNEYPYGTWTAIGDHYWVRDEYYILCYSLSECTPETYYTTEFYLFSELGAQQSNSCGDADLNSLIAEYRTRTLRRVPQCSDFKQIDRSAVVSSHGYFTWGDVNHPEDNDHSWAIVTAPVIVGLDNTWFVYLSSGYEPLRINSGYRSPNKNAALPRSVPNSTHQWGWAADFDPLSAPRNTALSPVAWQVLVNYAQDEGAVNIEPYASDPTHVHAEWY